MTKKKKRKKKVIFEINYQPEHAKEMQKTYLSWLGSLLVCKTEIRGFG